MVRDQLFNLSPAEQEGFIEEYRRKTKSTLLAYLLWFTGIAFFGFHYAYVRRWGVQIIYWLTLGGVLIWWLIDLFRVSGMVKDYNKDVAVDVLRNLKSIRN